jgi:hypothetical protein
VIPVTEIADDFSHTPRSSNPKWALVNREFKMADLKITDSHFVFQGKSHFRGGAAEAELGSVGETKRPIFGINYIEVQGRVPASKLKIRQCVTVESHYAETTEADLLANISVAGVFKGSSKTALKDLREGRIKLIQFVVDNEDLRAATNASPKILHDLIEYGNDARIVDTVFTVVEASTAEVFGASKSLSLSVNAGVVKVSADGSIGGSGAVSLNVSAPSTFAYGMVKLQWDASLKKNKTRIVKLTDDQWGPS